MSDRGKVAFEYRLVRLGVGLGRSRTLVVIDIVEQVDGLKRTSPYTGVREVVRLGHCDIDW